MPNTRWAKYIFVLAAWFGFGGFDFGSGFVEFSRLRLGLLGCIALFLLPVSFPFPAAFARISERIQRRPIFGYGFLLVLTLLGYALFLSRYMRGANMGDDAIFYEVIERTSQGCFFCFPDFGGSYFAGHNNLFLVLFVPLTAFSFWWPLVHFLHSLVIVAWCRVGGWAWGGNSSVGWGITVALFLATYTQHAAFYDARFAALSLAIFSVGVYLQRSKWLWWGGLSTLPMRETAGLTLFAFGLFGALVFRQTRKILVTVALLGLLWWIGSYVLVLYFGGPIVPRFDPCLRLNLGYQPDLNCMANTVVTDAPLKLAYTLRLARFAVAPGALPSLIASVPDLAFTWISKDNVLYNLSWHYYMQALGLVIVGAGLASKRSTIFNLPVRWVVASCLWQFVTLVRPQLF